ncbi:MAG: hypothetical protein EA349_01015 [Halomonadaceae bacterium]|nr:MAG: hypothetical protein EA349_01015 [Halomonadaceae bacterium]
MKHSIQRLALIVALCPAAAMASDLSYNYVEGGIALYPSADRSQDYVGFDSRLSAELTPEVFVFGGLKYLTDDVDYTAIHAGVGFQHGLNRQTSLWGGVTMEYQDFDFPGNLGSVDDTSIGLRGGLRHQLNQDFEIGGSARVITGDLDYVGFAFTTRYALSRDLSFLGELDVFDGDLGIIAGVSLAF